MREEHNHDSNMQVSRGTPQLTLMTPKAASALQASSFSIPLTLNTEDAIISSSEMASRMGSRSVSATGVYGLESKRGSMEDLRVIDHVTSMTASAPTRKRKEESLLITTPKRKEFDTSERMFCEERLAEASEWTRYKNVKAEVEYAYAQENEMETKSEYGPVVKHELVPKPLIISDYRIIRTVGSEVRERSNWLSTY